MGVTLQAAIETYHEAEPYRREHWWTEVSEVCFGKDYELSANLAEAGSREGWPPDAPSKRRLAEHLVHDDKTGTEWLTGEEFVNAVALCEEPTEVALGIVALLAAFSRPTRLLFWRE